MAVRVRLVILGFWVGVIALFSFVVAPAAFAVLPTQQMAGTLVSRVLSGVETVGVFAGVVLIAISILRPLRQPRARFLELGLLVLMTAVTAISHFFVSARLHALRTEFGDRLGHLSAEDHLRRNFDLLHHLSVGLMGFTLLAALTLLAVLLLSRPDTRSAPRETRNNA